MAVRKLDVSEVEAALKRAARAGMSGHRDERSGRFVARDTQTGELLPKKMQSSGTSVGRVKKEK